LPPANLNAKPASRFLIDPTDGKASNQFSDWPVAIRQAENRGENRLD